MSQPGEWAWPQSFARVDFVEQQACLLQHAATNCQAKRQHAVWHQGSFQVSKQAALLVTRLTCNGSSQLESLADVYRYLACSGLCRLCEMHFGKHLGQLRLDSCIIHDLKSTFTQVILQTCCQKRGCVKPSWALSKTSSASGKNVIMSIPPLKALSENRRKPADSLSSRWRMRS